MKKVKNFASLLNENRLRVSIPSVQLIDLFSRGIRK